MACKVGKSDILLSPFSLVSCPKYCGPEFDVDDWEEVCADTEEAGDDDDGPVDEEVEVMGPGIRVNG